MRVTDYRGDLPSPPLGGGYLVLNRSQIGCWDLICAIRYWYPDTEIIVSRPIPV